MDEPQKEVLRQRQAQISSVMQHPGWEAWVAEAKREIERVERRMLREAKRYEGADQRKLDYARGYIDALKYTYKMPSGAEARLAQFMRELEAEDERAD